MNPFDIDGPTATVSLHEPAKFSSRSQQIPTWGNDDDNWGDSEAFNDERLNDPETYDLCTLLHRV